MSLFFGGGSKTKPQFTGLAIQTSTSSVPVPILFGMNRLAPNIILQTDFKSHKQKQSAGKGGGKGATTYTYSGTYQLALCYGQIGDIPRMWKDQSKENNYAALGFSLFNGAANQAPWGYLVSNHPDMALGYPHIAHLDAANYDLGQTNALGQHSFEIQGPLYNTQVGGSGDADPAQCVDKLINNPIYGAVGGAVNTDNQVPLVNLLSTGAAPTTGDSAFQTYCRAMGFGLSPSLISQEPANTIIERWADLCNTAMVWTGSAIKFIPRGTETKTGNGVTYLPDVTVRYSLTDRDFIRSEGEDPITFDRIDPADAYNMVTLNIRNRDNEYNTVPATWVDQGLVDQFGPKPKDVVEAPEVCKIEIGGVMAALIGQRTAYIRNTYNFKLPVSFCLLEPMDICQAYDPRWGAFSVRITEIEENDEDQLTIHAEEYGGPGGGGAGMTGGGIGNTGPVPNVPITNNPINSNVAPGPVNAPIFIQPPPTLTNYQPEIWAAVSGGDNTTYNANWGGCQVWLSTDGGTSYSQIGTIDAPARMGTLTAALAAYGGANPDITNTMAVSTALSNAELSDATVDDAAAGVTLVYVEPEGANVEEFLSYKDVTLTGTNAYNVTNLYRGRSGSTPGAHGIGARWARLDSGLLFKYQFPLALIGETIFVKLVSFNIFGGGLEDISSVTPYSFTITNDYTYGISLEELNDVDVTGIVDGSTLVWDATLGKWVVGSGGGATVTVSTTAPVSPEDGDLWWKSDEGRLKVYYVDTDSSQWVDVMPVGAPGNGSGGGGNTSWELGSVNRKYLVNATAAGSFVNNPDDSLQSAPVNSFYWNTSAGAQSVTFDFGVDRRVDGIGWFQDNGTGQGTWSIEASPDNATWTTLKTGIVLAPTLQLGYYQQREEFDNATAYRYYRMTKTAGSTSSSPYVNWFIFKVAA